MTRRREFTAASGKPLLRDTPRATARLLEGYRQHHHGVVAGDFKFRRGMIYTQVRAISARINQNFDAWPSVELKKSYRSFIGKPCFVNHQNEDPSLARGRVVAARYVEKGADKYIETVMEIDAKRFPKLAREIRSGGLDSVSMGVEAGFTICSVCDNKATDTFDMCSHIKLHKGEKLLSHKTGKKTLVFERCYKLGFFELSYVFDPADETAVVSRVIAAARQDFRPSAHPWKADSDAYQDRLSPQQLVRGRTDPELLNAFDHASPHEQDRADPLGLARPYTPGRDRFEVPDHLQPHSRTSANTKNVTAWYRTAYGETVAPEDVDTLRDESEDDTNDFHHWVESPQELRAPDMDQTQRLDRAQENDGLDGDRRVEDAEDVATPAHDVAFRDEEEQPDDEPVMPINPPPSKKGRRTNRGVSMGRYHYAADDDGDVGALIDEAEHDLDAYDEGGDDPGADDGAGYDDDFDGDDGGDDDSDDDDSDDDGDDFDDDDDDFGDDGDDDGDDSDDVHGDPHSQGAPPWAVASRGLAARARVASRRRHGADNGYTDGGPYGDDYDQGEQEEVFISQVPASEAVDAPSPGTKPISNTPGNLVASRPKFDPRHYQRLADVVSALPPAERRAMADRMVNMFTADDRRFNWRTFFEAARVPVVKRGNRYFYAEAPVDPKVVNPSLDDTGANDLKGEFCDLKLDMGDKAATQPKDASIHAFRQFDAWLQQVTGRTAAQHGNANFIRRAAASYVTNTGRPLQSLFPTLEYVLREARNVEDRRSAMQRRAQEESLEVAAPQGRIDVGAPVKNITDEKAQSSQFDLRDFAHNAGDDIADPVLDVVDGNAGTWAPDRGRKSSSRLASGVEAVRLAEAYIAAMPGKYTNADRWTLTARFETLRQPVVRERIRLLEAVIEDHKTTRTARKVTAASSRGTKGIPPGLGSGRQMVAGRKVAASDPDTDSLMFLG